MQKNTAGKWVVFAFEDEGGTNPGEPVTGDAANITANVRIDGGAANAVDDTNPTELEDGYYVFDITAAESNGDHLLICPASSTANVNVIGVPGAVWTTPANFPDLGIDATGEITEVSTLTGHTAQTGDSYARIGSNGSGLTGVPWNSAWDAQVESEVTDGLTAYNAVATTDLPTNFGDLSITATTGRVDVASIEGSDATDQINAACDTALTDYDAVVPADLPANFADLNIEATTGIVDANVEKINTVTVVGAGTSGDKWRA